MKYRTIYGAVLSAALVAYGPEGIAQAVPADSPQPVIPESAGPQQCVPYLGDVLKGNGQFPLGLVPPDYGMEGYEDLPLASAQSRQGDQAHQGNQAHLPERVDVRDNTQGFNEQIEAALSGGDLFVRRVGDSQWREAPTPECLKGKITGISLNDDALLALDEAGWMYTLSNLQSSPQRWGWIRAWGGPVWLGKGMQMPTTQPGRWALSLIGTHTDRVYDTPDGKQQPVSLAKVTQAVALSEDGSRIYSLDPWLARDYSYEVGTPWNSRFQAEAISASGSVIFITNRYGDMYTRLSDFDVNGSDPAQFRYGWGEDERPAAVDAAQHRLNDSTAPIGLPGDDWHHQPKIPGRITSRISIHSTAPGSNNRELRVEGLDEVGNTGFWKKELTGQQWEFVPTGQPLQGKELSNPQEDRSADTLAEASPFHYRGELTPGVTMNVREFAYASPRRDVTLSIGGQDYRFIFHSVDGRLGTPLSMRMLPVESEFGSRPAGLAEGIPRNYMAAIEVPEETQQQVQANPALANFLAGYMENEQFHQVYLKVTPSQMEVWNSPVDNVAVPLLSEVAHLPYTEVPSHDEA
ncbi:hypothetical protein [Corynebacterium lowii]|uniref:Secreted protein n=1 Tax=Corynebacterium lowii TaxID=1544413 RepID=A0A0Q0YJD4_9CORY|nr:hypothetical protein [Corynebacterium lowii]KQB86928.1 hypothetical protein Clow_01139 [Corynebacterium lowii]MDP9851617.1 hypothetical protein [Corynebacterium lowii]